MSAPKIAALCLLVLSSLLAKDDIAKTVERECYICHLSPNPTAEQVKNMAAPPMWGVVRHLKRDLKDKERFLSFVSDYIMEPSADKMRFNKEAMKRFGLMPSMKGSLSKKEAKRVAEYLYETY
ncbi:MAG: c-type cytochrome [Hydrogenimonas sp.]|nr:c-type cytochrome [Hydrogenimonas sp.]